MLSFTQKGAGGRDNFSHAEGGGGDKMFWGSFKMVACSFSHTEGGGGGGKKFPFSQRGDAKIVTLS